jgi:hypothetical protein
MTPVRAQTTARRRSCMAPNVDVVNQSGQTPIHASIAIADIGPIDKAVELLTALILKSGATPKQPSKR